MNTNKEKDQSSNYEIQLALNEKRYNSQFNSIKNLKHVLIEAQKLYDQNDDTRVKNKCIEIRKTVQKQLTELENKSQQVTTNYLKNKRKLESLK